MRGPIRRPRLVGGNRMDGADRRAVGVNTVPVRPVRMTDMGFGGNRCELNGDQQDRRPKNPQKCAGQSHK